MLGTECIIPNCVYKDTSSEITSIEVTDKNGKTKLYCQNNNSQLLSNQKSLETKKQTVSTNCNYLLNINFYFYAF